MSLENDKDTICAIATSPGIAGVGIVRVSGSRCQQIAEKILGFIPQKRYATYTHFYDVDSKEVIDQGIALYFESPNSFTGEDVLELQGHGGYFITDRILKEAVKCGARLARPGEFSERAFLNDKLDLAQAEAIADLIEASTEEAARSALRTLQGDFSLLIHGLSNSIIDLRVYIEASIDFAEEEIDFLTEGKTTEKLQTIIDEVDAIFSKAKQGAILREGMSVVIAGKPNAGKSSLLNALAEKDSAIVTDIPGTTRDTLSEHINIDGMPLHITDTAGLRESDDVVEQEGIRRAHSAIEKADRILLVIDSSQEQLDTSKLEDYFRELGLGPLVQLIDQKRLSVIFNKIDKLNESPRLEQSSNANAQSLTTLSLSAKQKQGIDILRQHLKDCMGYQSSGESGFIARRRHLDALSRTKQSLEQALTQLSQHKAGELVAEDLKHAHRALGEITGEFTTDDLLGKIFSSFCVGK
ncbi:MAG: tRNA uridine-5-carboxymethylaminomethyl(34) synthesis GTPase MnmE [Pseudohongiellaceae bacterium]|nr:tRNA uridine-5-carboxymethylaminomethyl(34) synthesis GTPase MnmE [Pseudohongiellaceae bacterium]